MGLVSGGVCGGAAGGAEVAAPLLLLCWLCCWPDDPSSDTSSTGKHPQTPVVAHESTSRRRSGASPGEPPRRRAAPSAASAAELHLHLPSTSGHTRPPLSAHRSHEEIPRRRRSNLEAGDQDTRYHSAPSVIHEVLHRRDWERSTRDLYIPLKPEPNPKDADSDRSSPEAPHAEQESSSIEGLKSEERLNCKKHYTNIKSSRNRTRKESTREDIKDVDTTEGSMTNFYIGDSKADSYISSSIQEMINNDVLSNDKINANTKVARQSIKTMDRPTVPKEVLKNYITGFSVESSAAARVFEVDIVACLSSLDRSGAEHHDTGSRFHDAVCSSPFPPSSVEAVGYECLAPAEWEGGWLRGRARALAAAEGGLRARHASDGDILAPALRPESGAFSESDLDLESGDERPPPYDALGEVDPPARAPRRAHRETAI